MDRIESYPDKSDMETDGMLFMKLKRAFPLNVLNCLQMIAHISLAFRKWIKNIILVKIDYVIFYKMEIQ
ncbi:MAG: hypothetical protein IPL16_18775 [Ignavibacteria bacterium]|nr:hypothetical protein [Ignavibacteria bacterium]